MCCWRVLITYLLMAALFESWAYPLVIILSVPLGAVGGILGLRALGIYLQLQNRTPQALDVLTMLGFVILIGTVVNNAILIVHQALNLIRDEGYSSDDAILESVRTRVRPILMTTATTVLGLCPLVLFPGPAANSIADSAVCCWEACSCRPSSPCFLCRRCFACSWTRSKSCSERFGFGYNGGPQIFPARISPIPSFHRGTQLMNRTLIVVTLCLMSPAILRAELSLPNFFSDHMVLQRERAASIWGKANPESDVTVEFKGQTAKTKADADGRWRVGIETGIADARGADADRQIGWRHRERSTMCWSAKSGLRRASRTWSFR